MLYYSRNSKKHGKAKIGRFCRVINSEIGKYSYLGAHCVLRNASVGNFCSIAENVKIGFGNHPLNVTSTSPVFYAKHSVLGRGFFVTSFQEYERTFIGSDVLIGANTFIKDGITIGHGAVIGANSVVTKDIEPFSIVGGVPAKLIRMRFSEKERERLLNDEWWLWSERKIRENKHYFTHERS